MPTIQNEDAARPAILYIVGGVMTAVCLLIFFAAETEQSRQGAGLLWVTLGLPLLASGFIRARTLKRRGETFLYVEPLPLLFGEPFSGYVECGSSFDVTSAVISLEARLPKRSFSEWKSGNLKRGVSASAPGRQRLEFSGTAPNAADLWFTKSGGGIWSLRFTTGPLSRIVPGEFPVKLALPHAADVASPK